MKKMKKKSKVMITLGIAVFILAMVANLQYAMNGYGINKDNLKAGLLVNANANGSYYIDISSLGTSDVLPNSRLVCWLSGESYIAARFVFGSNGGPFDIENLEEPIWTFTSAQVRCEWFPEEGTCDQSYEYDASIAGF